MTLDVPKLDGRTYDDLVAEAYRRISRFCPEWTDFNPSDPGTTLVELFAWLTETMLYELNQVPDLAYLKFLELVGLRPRPALPAIADLTFTPNPQAERIVVPAAAQTAATGSDGSLVVFETDEELELVPHALADIIVADGPKRTSVLAGDATFPKAFRPLGWVPQVGNALYLGFTPAPGTPAPAPGRFPSTLRLHVTLPPSARAGLAQRCCDPSTDQTSPQVTLVWECKAREDETWWRYLPVLADVTAQFTREGYLTVTGPGEIYPTPAVEGREQRYWVRCRLAAGGYPRGREPEIDGIVPNTTTARNLVTVRDELLGQSEGHPDEYFRLSQTPVAENSVELEVREDPPKDGPPRWTQVSDFLASKPGDRHFTVDNTTGIVTFGDGRRGRIPPVDAEIVAVSYRHGAGASGNVPAGAIATLLSELPGVNTVTNARAATGGVKRQSIAELTQEAPALLRHQRRAVTAEDYAAFAREVPGVVDAIALPLVHPDHPGEEVPGAVTVVVVADSGDLPVPSSELIQRVCTYLEPYRLVATELYVRGPTVLPVTVKAKLVVTPDTSPGQVTREVEAAEAAVREFLAALRTTGDVRRAAFQQQPFLPARVQGVILTAVPQVLAVNNLTVKVRDQELTAEALLKPVPLAPYELITSGEHEITVQ